MFAAALFLDNLASLADRLLIISQLCVMNHELLVSAGAGRKEAAGRVPCSVQLANQRAIVPSIVCPETATTAAVTSKQE